MPRHSSKTPVPNPADQAASQIGEQLTDHRD